MGWNSILLVCNDALTSVDKDPAGFSKLISRKMGAARFGEGPFSFGNHSGYFDIPHIGHADEVALIAAGGNIATKLVTMHMGSAQSHHEEEGQVALLKALAKKLGYVVSRSPERMKGDYLDKIVERIDAGVNTFDDLCNVMVLNTVTKQAPRNLQFECRRIDRSLQKLRKAGRIAWSKTERRWAVVGDK